MIKIKYCIFTLIIFFNLFNSANAVVQVSVDRLEQIFKTYLPPQRGIIYTKVPRGLVISIDERIFFNPYKIKIKESSLPILDTMSNILKSLPNEFVIEGHTTESSAEFNSWELSISRASNLAQYLSIHQKLSTNKVTPLGLANFVPYRYETQDKSFNTNNRIDFVIIEYEAKR